VALAGNVLLMALELVKATSTSITPVYFVECIERKYNKVLAGVFFCRKEEI
jgi:hypothetical protein